LKFASQILNHLPVNTK